MDTHAFLEPALVQNPALATELSWQAVQACCEATAARRGLPFIVAFLVLPIAFHRKSATILGGKQRPGALQKAIVSDRAFALGLEERAQKFTRQSRDSLTLALACGLVTLDVSSMELFSTRKTPPAGHITKDVSVAMSAAKRLGWAAAEMSSAQIYSLLLMR